MQKDPVCGMQVDPARAAGSSEYKRQDLLLLLAPVQAEVRSRPEAVREVRGAPTQGEPVARPPGDAPMASVRTRLCLAVD